MRHIALTTLENCIVSLLFVVGVSAVLGGGGLIATNGLGMNIADLSGSPFDSYVIPGLILLLIVGGTHLFAAVEILMHRGKYHALPSVAGFGLMIWIYGELYMTSITHWLQTILFAIGVLEVSISILIARATAPRLSGSNY